MDPAVRSLEADFIQLGGLTYSQKLHLLNSKIQQLHRMQEELTRRQELESKTFQALSQLAKSRKRQASSQVRQVSKPTKVIPQRTRPFQEPAYPRQITAEKKRRLKDPLVYVQQQRRFLSSAKKPVGARVSPSAISTNESPNRKSAVASSPKVPAFASIQEEAKDEQRINNNDQQVEPEEEVRSDDPKAYEARRQTYLQRMRARLEGPLNSHLQHLEQEDLLRRKFRSEANPDKLYDFIHLNKVKEEGSYKKAFPIERIEGSEPPFSKPIEGPAKVGYSDRGPEIPERDSRRKFQPMQQRIISQSQKVSRLIVRPPPAISHPRSPPADYTIKRQNPTFHQAFIKMKLPPKAPIQRMSLPPRPRQVPLSPPRLISQLGPPMKFPRAGGPPHQKFQFERLSPRSEIAKAYQAPPQIIPVRQPKPPIVLKAPLRPPVERIVRSVKREPHPLAPPPQLVPPPLVKQQPGYSSQGEEESVRSESLRSIGSIVGSEKIKSLQKDVRGLAKMLESTKNRINSLRRQRGEGGGLGQESPPEEDKLLPRKRPREDERSQNMIQGSCGISAQARDPQISNLGQWAEEQRLKATKEDIKKQFKQKLLLKKRKLKKEALEKQLFKTKRQSQPRKVRKLGSPSTTTQFFDSLIKQEQDPEEATAKEEEALPQQAEAGMGESEDSEMPPINSEESDTVSMQSDKGMEDEIDEVVKRTELQDEIDQPESFEKNFDLQQLKHEVNEPYRPEEIDSQRAESSGEAGLSEKSEEQEESSSPLESLGQQEEELSSPPKPVTDTETERSEEMLNKSMMDIEPPEEDKDESFEIEVQGGSESPQESCKSENLQDLEGTEGISTQLHQLAVKQEELGENDLQPEEAEIIELHLPPPETSSKIWIEAKSEEVGIYGGEPVDVEVRSEAGDVAMAQPEVAQVPRLEVAQEEARAEPKINEDQVPEEANLKDVPSGARQTEKELAEKQLFGEEEENFESPPDPQPSPAYIVPEKASEDPSEPVNSKPEALAALRDNPTELNQPSLHKNLMQEEQEFEDLEVEEVLKPEDIEEEDKMLESFHESEASESLEQVIEFEQSAVPEARPQYEQLIYHFEQHEQVRPSEPDPLGENPELVLQDSHEESSQSQHAISKWTYSSEGDNIIEAGPIVGRSQISSADHRGAIKPYRPALKQDDDDNRLIKVLQKVPLVNDAADIEEEFHHGEFGSEQEAFREEPFSSPPQQQNQELTHMDFGRELTQPPAPLPRVTKWNLPSTPPLRESPPAVTVSSKYFKGGMRSRISQKPDLAYLRSPSPRKKRKTDLLMGLRFGQSNLTKKEQNVQEQFRTLLNRYVEEERKRANRGKLPRETKDVKLKLYEYSLEKGFRSRVTKYIIKNHGA